MIDTKVLVQTKELIGITEDELIKKTSLIPFNPRPTSEITISKQMYQTFPEGLAWTIYLTFSIHKDKDCPVTSDSSSCALSTLTFISLVKSSGQESRN